MNYKIANLTRILLTYIGLFIFTIGIIFFEISKKYLAIIIGIIGIITIILGFIIGFKFYRCPNCKKQITWIPLIVSNCNHCGIRLN